MRVSDTGEWVDVFVQNEDDLSITLDLEKVKQLYGGTLPEGIYISSGHELVARYSTETGKYYNAGGGGEPNHAGTAFQSWDAFIHLADFRTRTRKQVQSTPL